MENGDVKRTVTVYRISKISDLGEIPYSRIDKCLSDMMAGIKVSVKNNFGWEKLPYWEWIDDGEESTYIKYVPREVNDERI